VLKKWNYGFQPSENQEDIQTQGVGLTDFEWQTCPAQLA
jgi:hypothetical protein